MSEEQARAAMSRLTARFAADVAPAPEVSQVAYLRAAMGLTARPIPNDYPRSMRVICAAYRASDARPVALPDGAQR